MMFVSFHYFLLYFLHLIAQSCSTLCDPMLQEDSLPSKSPGKSMNTRVVSLSLPQGIFLTQESNQDLLYCKQILYQLSYQGSPLYSLDLTYLTKDHLSCGEGNGNPLQYSCLENPMGGGARDGCYSPWARKESDTHEPFHFITLDPAGGEKMEGGTSI